MSDIQYVVKYRIGINPDTLTINVWLKADEINVKMAMERTIKNMYGASNRTITVLTFAQLTTEAI